MTPGLPQSFVRRFLLVALGGFVIGTLTSVGQAFLPFELSPLANSAGAWSVAAFLLALIERVPRRAAVLGVVALAAMLAGYAVATQVRGYAVGTRLLLFWGVASVVVGPALGVGAAWVRGRDAHRAIVGLALIAGILIGEAVYGLTVVADTTPAAYWVGEAVVGAGAAFVGLRRRLWSVRHLAIGVALTGLVAAAFYATYSGNLIAFF